jgi:hypothetical protein
MISPFAVPVLEGLGVGSGVSGSWAVYGSEVWVSEVKCCRLGPSTHVPWPLYAILLNIYPLLRLPTTAFALRKLARLAVFEISWEAHFDVMPLVLGPWFHLLAFVALLELRVLFRLACSAYGLATPPSDRLVSTRTP